MTTKKLPPSISVIVCFTIGAGALIGYYHFSNSLEFSGRGDLVAKKSPDDHKGNDITPSNRPLSVDSSEPREGRSVAQPVAETTPDPDTDTEAQNTSGKQSEWSEYPRSMFPFAKTLVNRPSSIAAERLYRHKTLNPRDYFIDPNLRDFLVKIIDHYGSRIGLIDEQLPTIKARALKKAIDSDTSRRKALKGMIAKLPSEGREIYESMSRGRPGSVIVPDLLWPNREPVAHSLRNGTLHFGFLEDFPKVQALTQQKLRLLVEYGSNLVDFFGTTVGLDGAEQVSILQDLIKELEILEKNLEGIGGRSKGTPHKE